MATSAAFFAAFLIAALFGLYLSVRREIKAAKVDTIPVRDDVHS